MQHSRYAVGQHSRCLNHGIVQHALLLQKRATCIQPYSALLLAPGTRLATLINYMSFPCHHVGLVAQVRLIAAMLSPLLEAVVSHPSLADPASAAAAAAAGAAHHPGLVSGSTSVSPIPGAAHSPRPSASSSGAAASAAPAAAAAAAATGGTSSAAGAQVLMPLGPVAAAAAALLQLRLLEVFFFLPAAQLWGSCHEQLLQLCCRQLLGVGGARVSPGGDYVR